MVSLKLSLANKITINDVPAAAIVSPSLFITQSKLQELSKVIWYVFHQQQFAVSDTLIHFLVDL